MGVQQCTPQSGIEKGAASEQRSMLVGPAGPSGMQGPVGATGASGAVVVGPASVAGPAGPAKHINGLPILIFSHHQKLPQIVGESR